MWSFQCTTEAIILSNICYVSLLSIFIDYLFYYLSIYLVSIIFTIICYIIYYLFLTRISLSLSLYIIKTSCQRYRLVQESWEGGDGRRKVGGAGRREGWWDETLVSLLSATKLLSTISSIIYPLIYYLFHYLLSIIFISIHYLLILKHGFRRRRVHNHGVWRVAILQGGSTSLECTTRPWLF